MERINVKAKQKVTDWHTHIGQYFDTFYDFHDVFRVLVDNGIDETILAYLTPKFEDEKISVDFYKAVVEELNKACVFAVDIGLKINVLYWADPHVLKEFSLETIFSHFPYYGIALHPRLHNWTMVYKKEIDDIFMFAEKQHFPIFIHTGTSDSDKPKVFEDWFKRFPKVEVHLAHCKEPNQIIDLFSKYDNLFGDTAFCPLESYNKICEAGFKNRMLFGSDFPVTHYFATHTFGKNLSLEEEYEMDCQMAKKMM